MFVDDMLIRKFEERKLKYNIDSKYEENVNYNKQDLYIEIMQESFKRLKEEKCDEIYLADIRNISRRFANEDGTGILDKLEKACNLDVKKIYQDNTENRFDMLKLMKYLYFIDKFNSSTFVQETRRENKKDLFDKEPFPLLDILLKPRLENIEVQIYDSKSRYGKDFVEVMNDISLAVDNSQEIFKELLRLDYRWTVAVQRLFEYVFSNGAMLYGDDALNKLRCIKRALHSNIISNLPETLSEKTKSNCIMEVFYIRLICHSFLCMDNDKCVINNELDDLEQVADSYVKCYSAYDEISVDTEILQVMKEGLSKGYLSDEYKSEVAIDLIKLISYLNQITDDDKKLYIYALDRAGMLIEHIGKNLNQDFSKDINVTILVAIIQEIIYVKKHKISVTNDFYGYTNKSASLKLLLQKSGDGKNKMPAIVRESWIKRIKNRVAYNYGQHELIKAKREVENKLYEIKRFIYGHDKYQKLDDIVFAGELLCDAFSAIIVNMENVEIFEEIVVENIQKSIPDLNVAISVNFKNKNVFLKTLFNCESSLYRSFIDRFVRFIKKVRKNESCSSDKGNYIYTIKNTVEYKFCVVYQYDRNNNIFIIKDSVVSVSDEDLDRIDAVGLSNIKLLSLKE